MSFLQWHGIQPICGSRKRALFWLTITKKRAKKLADEKCSKIDRTCDKWKDLKPD